jgi:hypothetical protein
VTKCKRYTWGQFCAKQDYEGIEYMITQIDPKGVPKELEVAHTALQAAYNAWEKIAQDNHAEYNEEDDA